MKLLLFSCHIKLEGGQRMDYETTITRSYNFTVSVLSPTKAVITENKYCISKHIKLSNEVCNRWYVCEENSSRKLFASVNDAISHAYNLIIAEHEQMLIQFSYN